MTPAGRVRKGGRGEAEWALFLERHGIPAQRLGYAQRRMGGRVPDVSSFGRERLAWETKRVERGFTPVYNALNQARAVFGAVPALAFRMNGRPWLVALAAEDFVRLVQEEDPRSPRP